jgi:hypothetical protein
VGLAVARSPRWLTVLFAVCPVIGGVLWRYDFDHRRNAEEKERRSQRIRDIKSDRVYASLAAAVVVNGRLVEGTSVNFGDGCTMSFPLGSLFGPILVDLPPDRSHTLDLPAGTLVYVPPTPPGAPITEV